MTVISKYNLRQKLLALRNNLTSEDVDTKSRIIQEKVTDFFKKKNFQNFLVYMSVNNEVKTGKIIDYLLAAGKKIFLPAYIRTEHKWILSEFRNFTDLEDGPFKILQPKSVKPVDVDSVDVAILPGVAFDKKRVRLGYGKGVYDKLLADFIGLKVGLAYGFQIVDEIHRESHDLIVDLVISESSTIQRSLLNN